MKITNYACLNVIYGTNYPYIFVKTEIDDPKLNIAGDQFDFRGEYEFKLTSKENRVLNLTSENKNTSVLLLYQKRPIAWSGMEQSANGFKRHGLDSTPEKSKLNP